VNPCSHCADKTPDLFCLPCADAFVDVMQQWCTYYMSSPSAFDKVGYTNAHGWREFFKARSTARLEQARARLIEAHVAAEQIQTSSKKVRGRSQHSIDLIAAMYAAAEKAQPITGRGIGYKLFTTGLTPSMSKNDMQSVYRLLKEAREGGIIPWPWIVDESREIERIPSWDDPADYVATVNKAYRRDFWKMQPHRVQVWSEKGTVRGVLAPVLKQYGVDFLAVHGFGSATVAHNAAEDDDGRPLIVLYVGDLDPSGCYMSEVDLPARFAKYGGDHITLRRIALTPEQVTGLPSFPAVDKAKDPRFKWFVANHGDRCWELDAMDPNELRTCVERAIVNLIEPTAWQRCEVINTAERESLSTVLNGWGATAAHDKSRC
jgi:hypothetical protein